MTHAVRIAQGRPRRTSGAVARQLEFEPLPPAATSRPGSRPPLRLALSGRTLRGPEKYRLLEHRRRQAQIKARRLLDLAETADTGPAAAGVEHLGGNHEPR